MLGLGGSVGTKGEGIEAEVVVAHDFDELKLLGDRCRGRIVLFDRPMQPFDFAHVSSWGFRSTQTFMDSPPSSSIIMARLPVG